MHFILRHNQQQHRGSMAIAQNGHGEQSNRSVAVSHYLTQTAKIIEAWIKQGELSTANVSRYASTQEFRSKAKWTSLPKSGALSDDDLFAVMEELLNDSVNPWTGRFVDKLYTAPAPLGVASEALLASINANAHIMSAAPVLCLAEETCVAGVAELCGWDIDAADGMTMPGGSTSNTFAIQTALNNVYPMFKTQGLVGVISHLAQGRSMQAARPLIFTSEQGHYSLEKAAIACGMGLQSVVKVPCKSDGSMDVSALEKLLVQALENAQGTGDDAGMPFFVNATAGSTVTGSFDSLHSIAEVCAKFTAHGGNKLWLHVDGSWGGPVLFSSKHRQRMRGIERCDSLTINPHKLLNVPHQCSFALFRNGEALEANALDAPYLFHAVEDADGEIDVATSKDAARRAAILKRKLRRRESPAMMNFGCGRRGDAFKFYLAWLATGSAGFGAHVDRGIEAARQVVSHVHSTPKLAARLELLDMSGDEQQFLQVCVRPTLDARTATVADKSKATQYVYAALRRRKRFAVDFAPLGQGRGDYIRMVTHPSSSLQDLFDLVAEIADIGDEYMRMG